MTVLVPKVLHSNFDFFTLHGKRSGFDFSLHTRRRTLSLRRTRDGMENVTSLTLRKFHNGDNF